MTGRPRTNPRVARPNDHEELAELVREALRDLAGSEPDEYGPGRFALKVDDMEFVVLATEETFPDIRFDHRVLDAPDELRSAAVDFVNHLHGRSSTAGAHWWLGNASLWQVGHLWAAKFDGEVFVENFQRFVSIARDRTPEIRARVGGTVI